MRALAEAFEVLIAWLRDDVDVDGAKLGAVEHPGDAADDQVVHGEGAQCLAHCRQLLLSRARAVRALPEDAGVAGLWQWRADPS